MENLITKFRRRLTSVETRFVRGLYGRIEWNARAISIQGARGTGKSTMLLQHVLLGQLPLERTLYLSLDDLHFQDHRLEEVAEEFILHGGRHLLLDEVHKYPGWQAVVKNLYDFNPNLRIAVSGSSILALQDALPDLGRRMLIYDLPELSLREFIALKHGIELPAITWESLLDDHVRIAMEYAAALKHPLAHVKEHHVIGAYPFFMEGEADYAMRLNQLVNLMIDYDLPDVVPVTTSSRVKLKQLLYILSTSVPFTPNIAKLAQRLDVSRMRLLELLHILERARLVRSLHSERQGVSLFNKPQKLLLHNANLIHLLGEGRPDIGNLRETWSLSQLAGAGLNLRYPEKGDVLVNGRQTLEIGGRNKKGKQLAGIEDGYIVRDDIEHGSGRTLPMWLLGFLH